MGFWARFVEATISNTKDCFYIASRIMGTACSGGESDPLGEISEKFLSHTHMQPLISTMAMIASTMKMDGPEVVTSSAQPAPPRR